MRLAAGAKKKLDVARTRSLFKQSDLSSRTVYLPLNVAVNKAATEEAQKAAPEKRAVVLEGYASTPTLDAHRHVVALAAWKKPSALARYQKNPIVLFDHDTGFPVGTAEETTVDKQGLFVRLTVSGAAKIPTDEPIGDALDDGRLRTLSIGIRIYDYEITEVEDEVFATITDLELLEISIVTVPANEDAIFDVVKGIEQIIVKSIGGDADKPNGGNKMDRELICKSLGLDPKVATDDDIMKAMNRVLVGAKSAQDLRKSLNLAPDAPEEDVAKKLGELTAARGENKKMHARELVEKYADRIAPSLEAWALKKAENDPADFEEWAKGSPVLAIHQTLLGKKNERKQEPGNARKSATISDEDERFMKMFGVFDDAADMEKMANTTPAEAMSWIFSGRKFALSRADEDTLKKRAVFEMIA